MNRCAVDDERVFSFLFKTGFYLSALACVCLCVCA